MDRSCSRHRSAPSSTCCSRARRARRSSIGRRSATYALAAMTFRRAARNRTRRPSSRRLRTNADMAAERARIAPYLDGCAGQDAVLRRRDGARRTRIDRRRASSARCTLTSSSDGPGRCPECRMKLVPAADDDVRSRSARNARPRSRAAECGMKLGHRTSKAPTSTTGIRAEHARPHATRTRTPPPGSSGKTTWSRSTGRRPPPTCAGSWSTRDRRRGPRIDWRFRVGDQVKIRLVNTMDSDHPMPHPFHVHGAGRFLILARDGMVEPNLVWKDTVLVRTGETVDILLDVTNPGRLDGALPHRRAPRERDDVLFDVAP